MVRTISMHPVHKLEVVDQAHQLALACYTAGLTIGDRNVRWQLQRSSQAIAANLVEGAGSESQASFARYIAVALASTKETEYHLLFSRDAGLLAPEHYEALTVLADNLAPGSSDCWPRYAATRTGGPSPKPDPPIHICGLPSTVYSCAGSGSIVSGSHGTCTSSRNSEVIRKTRILGKASMNCA
jgi:four helix bundle protein